MATELFDVRKKGVLLQVHDFINKNQKSTIKTEFGFTLHEFPRSWEEYDALLFQWRRIIDGLVNLSPRPQLKFMAAINIPKMLYSQRPTSFHWAQYQDPEILLNCEAITTWLHGCYINDLKKETVFLTLILNKSVDDLNPEFKDVFADIERKEITNHEHNSGVYYFVPLSNIVHLKFELE